MSEYEAIITGHPAGGWNVKVMRGPHHVRTTGAATLRGARRKAHRIIKRAERRGAW